MGTGCHTAQAQLQRLHFHELGTQRWKKYHIPSAKLGAERDGVGVSGRAAGQACGVWRPEGQQGEAKAQGVFEGGHSLVVRTRLEEAEGGEGTRESVTPRWGFPEGLQPVLWGALPSTPWGKALPGALTRSPLEGHLCSPERRALAVPGATPSLGPQPGGS